MAEPCKEVCLEKHEIRLLIESIYKNKEKLLNEGWAGGSIPLLLKNLGYAWGAKAFTEDYPEIVKYIDEELGKPCESEDMCMDIKKMIDDEEQAQKGYSEIKTENPLIIHAVEGIKKDEKRHYDELKKIYQQSCLCERNKV